MTNSNSQIIFHVSPRSNLGSVGVKKLQKSELAGNIYGLSKESTAVKLDRNGFRKLYQEVGDTGLIYLQVDDQKSKVPVLIDDVQYHPATSEVVHVVFRRVNLQEAITTAVQIELVGESDIPGTNVIQVLNELEVSALPTDLPESIEVDISELREVGDSITIADLKYDKSKVEIVFSGESDESAPVVLLQEQKEETEEEEPTDVAEVEVTEQKSEDNSDSQE